VSPKIPSWRDSGEFKQILYIFPVSSSFQQDRSPVPFIEKFNKKGINIRILAKIEKGRKNFAFLILTGGCEQEVINQLKNTEGTILLLCHREDNSFPAGLEILARIQQMNRRGKIILLNEKEEDFLELKNMIRIMKTEEEMKRVKIGLIGHPSHWLVAGTVKYEVVTACWGPKIIQISLAELLDEIYKTTDSDSKKYAEEFIEKSSKSVEPHKDAILKSAGVYRGIRNIIERYNLHALTLQCFELIKELKTTGCFALSLLTDEGIISGCEGDIPSILTMFWMYCLTGELPFMANPQDIDIKENTISLAHCTVPRKLLKSYTIRSHFESSLGVAIEGKMEKGEITLARIGGKDLRKLFVTGGKILKPEYFEHRCRTQIKVKLEHNVDYFLKNPLGNHHVLVRGHWASLLEEYVRYSGIVKGEKINE